MNKQHVNAVKFALKNGITAEQFNQKKALEKEFMRHPKIKELSVISSSASSANFVHVSCD